MEQWDFVIVGAGSAGLAAAKEIQSHKRYATILIVAGEKGLPYKRTKISKIYAQQVPFDEIVLEPESFYTGASIRLKKNTIAILVDWQNHELALNDGSRVRYGKLLIASGSNPVIPRLPDEVQKYAHAFWNREQFEMLKRDTAALRDVVVAGMGVLGVEMAEQLSLSGKRVQLIGHGRSPMQKYLTPRSSAILAATLEAKGIELGFDEEIVNIEAVSHSEINILTTQKNRRCGGVLFCIGAEPATQLAADSGIAVQTGIVVDSYLKTSVPDVYAAGDAAQHPGRMFTHLWHAAEDQGECAARSMLEIEQNTPYISPGYRLKCEVFGDYFFSFADSGRITGCDFTEHLRKKRYLGLYSGKGIVRGVVMVNDKDNAKSYEKAVRDSWTVEKTLELFSRA